MAEAFLCHPKQSNKIVQQHMPLLTDNVSLVNVVGKDFWTLLQILNVDHDFSNAGPKSLQQNSGYITAHNFVKNLNVVNDVSECAVGRLTAFNMGNTTRSRKRQDWLRSVVSMLRQTQYETVTSCESDKVKFSKC